MRLINGVPALIDKRLPLPIREFEETVSNRIYVATAMLDELDDVIAYVTGFDYLVNYYCKEEYRKLELSNMLKADH